MLGLFIPRASPIHTTPAGAKVLVLVGLAVAVLFITDPLRLAGLLAGVGALFAVARLPVRDVLVQLRPVLFISLFFFVVHAALASWQTGLVTVLRFTILIVLATLITLTTRVSDMVEAIERGLRPLRRLGANPEKISFMISLAIRFVPLLLDLARDIQAAQKARGLERSVVAMAVPLIVKTLRMANSLTEAIEARGYDPD